MQTIVLDYADAKIVIINHEKEYQTEEMEQILIEQYDLKLDEIEWMTTRELHIETKNSPK